MHTQTQNCLTLVTWNVRGIRTQSKKNKIFNYLHQIKPDICLLQETHLEKEDLNHFQCKEFTNIYSSTLNSKQCGVSILIHNKLLYNHLSTIIDSGGRFVIINGNLANHNLTIINIYGPNNDNPSFFHDIFSKINDTSNIILAGDFNTVLDPNLDRSHFTRNNRHWRSTDTIKQYMQEFGLGDSWRSSHPQKRQYTYFSQVHKTSSRIDFILLSNALLLK